MKLILLVVNLHFEIKRRESQIFMNEFVTVKENVPAELLIWRDALKKAFIFIYLF